MMSVVIPHSLKVAVGHIFVIIVNVTNFQKIFNVVIDAALKPNWFCSCIVIRCGLKSGNRWFLHMLD
jgi:hypothetical protein